MIARYMNSYLKQAHTNEVEKIGINGYKVLLNFNYSAWNRQTLIVHIFFMLKTRSKVEKT